MNKDLQEKAIKIQGKSYVLVSDRILYFNESYPLGCITTDLVKYEDKQIIVKATVYPSSLDNSRYFTGYSQSIEGQGFINKTSALENAETSAVGRALAMMGIGVIDSIASVDEINKANGASVDKSDSFNKQNFGKRNMDNLKAAVEKGERTNNKEETLKYLHDTYNLKDDAEGWVIEYFDRLPTKELPEELGTTAQEAFNQ